MQDLISKVSYTHTYHRKLTLRFLTVLRSLDLSAKGFLSHPVLLLGLNIVSGILEVLAFRGYYDVGDTQVNPYSCYRTYRSWSFGISHEYDLPCYPCHLS